MAAESGQSGSRLTQRLLDRPEAFELFQAVRLLEAEALRDAIRHRRPLPPELGSQDTRAGTGDTVRFQSATTLGFPGGAITRARRLVAETAADGDEEERVAFELEVATFGLIGPSGVLPRHYTELVARRLRTFHDATLRDFLDIFTHRATSLLHRAWGKYRLPAERERVRQRGASASWDHGEMPGRDGFSAVLACLVGLGARHQSGRLRVRDELLTYYAGHLSHFPRSAVGLEAILSDAWGIPARVEQFVGRWLNLEPADQTRLRDASCPLGQHTRLGVDAIAGTRVWSIDSAFRIDLGPLSLTEFVRWLPGGARLAALSDLVRLYAGQQFDVTVRPVLAAGEVPALRLARMERNGDGSPQGSRLGWTTWLISHPPLNDATDAEFKVDP